MEKKWVVYILCIDFLQKGPPFNLHSSQAVATYREKERRFFILNSAFLSNGEKDNSSEVILGSPILPSLNPSGSIHVED